MFHCVLDGGGAVLFENVPTTIKLEGNFTMKMTLNVIYERPLYETSELP